MFNRVSEWIDARKVNGWMVIRAHPHLMSITRMRIPHEYLEVWKGDVDQGEKLWYDGYVTDDPRFIGHASVFSTFELATWFADLMRSRWPKSEFVVVATSFQPTVTSKE